ncbi:TetR family transcriptional regulator, partial [Rhizobium leguminosarum]|nr:TetR family transcriptional regulator [Rhizobium leguminosarum]
YPTIERSRLLLDNDWDGAFSKGLDFLLDGLAPRQ